MWCYVCQADPRIAADVLSDGGPRPVVDRAPDGDAGGSAVPDRHSAHAVFHGDRAQRPDASVELMELASINLENVQRLGKMERSIVSVIDALRKMLPTTKVNNIHEDEK